MGTTRLSLERYSAGLLAGVLLVTAATPVSADPRRGRAHHAVRVQELPPAEMSGEPGTDRPGLFASWLESDDPESEARIRFLGERSDPKALRELVELAYRIDDEPRRKLALVEALARDFQGGLERTSDERTRIARALLHLATSPRGTTLAADPLQFRLRGTLAFALALSHDDVNEKRLVADAFPPGDHDPDTKRFARRALSSFGDPTRLAELAKTGFFRPDPISRRPTCSPDELANAPSDDERFSCLERFFASEARSSELDWSKALASPSRAYALRALTILAHERPELRELVLREAESSRNAKSAPLRAAAHFAGASFDAAAWRAASDRPNADPVVESVFLRSSHSGTLAADARRLLPTEDRIALWTSVELPERRAPVALAWQKWRDHPDHPLFVPSLAAALGESDAPSPGANLHEVRSWLGSPNPILRAATAYGLGFSASSLADGLLVRAYRHEPDDAVRRALIVALGRRFDRRPGAGVYAALAAARRLDPDPCVRRLALELTRPDLGELESTEDGRRSFTFGRAEVVPTRENPLLITTLEGRPIPIETDPDGFYAVLGLPFCHDTDAADWDRFVEPLSR